MGTGGGLLPQQEPGVLGISQAGVSWLDGGALRASAPWEGTTKYCPKERGPAALPAPSPKQRRPPPPEAPGSANAPRLWPGAPGPPGWAPSPDLPWLLASCKFLAEHSCPRPGGDSRETQGPLREGGARLGIGSWGEGACGKGGTCSQNAAGQAGGTPKRCV